MLQQRCNRTEEEQLGEHITERLYRNLGIKQEGNDRKDRMGEEITKD